MSKSTKKIAPLHEIRLTLRALVYREADWWLAHCLELDLVGEGKTPQAAFETLLRLTNLQIEAALEVGDLQSIFRAAPADIQASFAIAQDKQFTRNPTLPAKVERFDVRTLAAA